MSGTYEVEIQKIPITIPSPAGDLYADQDPDLFLFSAIQDQEFVIDLVIKLYEVSEQTGEGGPVTVTTQLEVDDVVCELANQYSSVSFQVTDSDPLNYTVRLTGTLVNIIGGETYTVVLPTNDPTQGFPIVTTSPGASPNNYLAIIAWALPTILSGGSARSYELLTDAYTFTINPDTENQVYTMSQYVYWDYTTSIQRFITKVEGGVI